jgi:hypothetical protein
MKNFDPTYDYIYPIIINASEFKEFELVKYLCKRNSKAIYIKELGDKIIIYIQPCKNFTNLTCNS